ncbi:uncharacterized protein VTP21DRAFT_1175 [Calcarisporiella thermophila]|uniref:uncharacterized protein n=1 Tax=Calcarisporiella thermophila TaxID=911321 RepID=UPI003744985E
MKAFSLRRALVISSILVASAGLLLRSAEAAPRGHWNRRQAPSSEQCADQECKDAADGITKDGNFTADPCTDFFEYSCGNFLATHEIPPDKPYIGTFDILNDRNLELLRSVLESPFAAAPNVTEDENKVDQTNHQTLVDFYRSCMDNATIASKNAQPALQVVKLVTDNLPLQQPLPQYVTGEQPQQAPAADAATLAKVFAQMERHNIGSQGRAQVSGPFYTFVDADAKDTNKNVLWVTESTLGLSSKEYYSEQATIDAYKTAVADVFALVLGELAPTLWPNTQVGNETWTKLAEQVVQFETQIANITLTAEEKADNIKTYNPTKLTDLAQLSPAVDWKAYLQGLLGEGATLPETVIIDSPTYYNKLSNEILAKTPASTVQAYLIFRSINYFVGGLGIKYQMPLRRLSEKLSGVSADVFPPRWKTCVRAITPYLGQSLGRYFVLKAFPGNSKEVADDMIQGLRTTLKEVTFPNANWLDDQTRSIAQEKLAALVQKIGYGTQNPNIMSPASIAKYYEGVTATADDYFGNVLRANQVLAAKAFSEYGKPVDKSIWQMNPQTVNAYYSPLFNEIVFPAGILQTPFFNAKLPEYLNFGGMGVVVGHEISHAFDNSGRLFAANGSMVEWWTNATTKAFEERAQCFIDEYGNFTIKDENGKDVNVNGKLTQGENIADNGGLNNAFISWQRRFQSDPQMQKYNNRLIPGLEKFTREQLFFVAYARVWCENTRPASLVNQVRTDPHSPPRWRVNGAVVNSPAFADAFKCAPGSPMNPQKKCQLW